MQIDAFLSLPFVVQFHICAALLAFVLGPIALLRRRRDFWQKALGYGFVVAMAATAVSASFIFSIRLVGPFSPIHLLIPLVLVSLWRAIANARAGRIAAHRKIMTDLYWQAIGVAGAFTFLPGRAMNEIVFGGGSWAGFFAVVLIGTPGMVWLARRSARFAAIDAVPPNQKNRQTPLGTPEARG